MFSDPQANNRRPLINMNRAPVVKRKTTRRMPALMGDRVRLVTLHHTHAMLPMPSLARPAFLRATWGRMPGVSGWTIRVRLCTSVRQSQVLAIARLSMYTMGSASDSRMTLLLSLSTGVPVHGPPHTAWKDSRPCSVAWEKVTGRLFCRCSYKKSKHTQFGRIL